ncbi:cytosolic endo-beta-N-acetylglucosaminidase isoform X1 [Mesoplodon densirostris]|uniref:cytosolic endo-beta-N-acetylglucosaminidase isoform X1 n=1 Tax=Mesoplodon densirostris TaxID=48708 RepID=UPI0028DD0981|nr:cytosolic endo-beta-N-acetylglucosaminidase isoform X1 [Mesoplodon densirostris]
MEAAGTRARAAARRRDRRLRAPATVKEQRDPQPGVRLPQRRIEEAQEEAVFREVVSFTPDPLPVRYYDKDTTKPISFYLSSLEELLAWTPDVEDGFNVALGPPECRQPPLSSRRPRTLVCHDMMGGYLDDKFIQGSATQSPYSFYHWQYIDVFVYFSHHTVTIPPVGWTNAAHRHGVCVLGTFITEWKEGERLCEAFLAGDERSYQAVARQLVLIAQFFRFDGWLINIENSLSLAAVGNVPHFLRYLTTELHQQVPRGLVLWYDSVVSSGQLTWQDELNEHNRVFFDSCDGFFTNYNWREEHLERMLGQAGERLADVYVGVDVFARGSVVGGRFHTDKGKRGSGDPPQSGETEAPRSKLCPTSLPSSPFLQSDVTGADPEARVLGGSVRTWLGVRVFGEGGFLPEPGQVLEFAGTLSAHAQHLLLALCHFLLPGHGDSKSLLWPGGGCGALVPPERPGNPAPVWRAQAGRGGTGLGEDALLPGRRLERGQLSAYPGADSARGWKRVCEVPVPPKIFLSMVYKLEGPSAVGVALELTTGDTGSCHVGGIAAPSGEGTLLASSFLTETSSRRSPRPLRVPPTKLAKWVGRCGQQLSGGWVQRCYEVNLRGCLLQALFVNFSRPPGSQKEENFVCRLGEIQVVDANSLLTPLPQVQAVTVSQVRWQSAASEGEGGPTGLRLSCTLHWAHLLPHVRCFRIHCCRGSGGDSPCRGPLEPERPTLLGLAFVNRYRIVDLAVAAAEPGRDGRVEFLVEPIPKEGFLVPRAEWGRAAMLYSTPHT